MAPHAVARYSPSKEPWGLPVKYVGTGETLEDLEAFDPDAFVDAILANTVSSAS